MPGRPGTPLGIRVRPCRKLSRVHHRCAHMRACTRFSRVQRRAVHLPTRVHQEAFHAMIGDLLVSIFAYSSARGDKRTAKQALKVACGSLKPALGPASLACTSEIYMACSGVSWEIGAGHGRVAVRKRCGWMPPAPELTTFLLNSMDTGTWFSVNFESKSSSRGPGPSPLFQHVPNRMAFQICGSLRAISDAFRVSSAFELKTPRLDHPVLVIRSGAALDRGKRRFSLCPRVQRRGPPGRHSQHWPNNH